MPYTKSEYYTIYAYIAPDGRRYIGKTGSQKNERAGHGGANYKHCGCFWKAIIRYGWDAFEYEVLATIPKSDDNANQKACELESRYIMQYQTTNIRFGFNRFKKDSPRSYDKLAKARRNRRIVNKDGIIKQISQSEFESYLKKGWNPGYKGAS